MLFIMLFWLRIVLSCGLHPKIVLDSGFRNSLWNLDSGFQKQKFPEFQILKAKIFWIPDFTGKNLLDSEFHKQKFTGFRNSLSKIFMTMESG